MHQIAKGLVFPLLFAATPALAEEWIGVAEAQEMAAYVDVDSIRADGTVHTFDLFTGYMYGQGKAGEIYYVVYKMELDCGSSAFSVGSLRAFDIDRKLFASANDGAIEDPLAETEFAAALRDFVCGAERDSSRKADDPFRASDDYFGGF